MENNPLLLDTNILWNLDLCRRLTEQIQLGKVRVFVPTIIHAERIRQTADRFGSRFAIEVVRQFINDSRFELLPLSVEQAETVAAIWLELSANGIADDYWNTHRFDIVLCAIARSTGFTLVTEENHSQHFRLIAERMRAQEIENWLATL